MFPNLFCLSCKSMDSWILRIYLKRYMLSWELLILLKFFRDFIACWFGFYYGSFEFPSLGLVFLFYKARLFIRPDFGFHWCECMWLYLRSVLCNWYLWLYFFGVLLSIWWSALRSGKPINACLFTFMSSILICNTNIGSGTWTMTNSFISCGGLVSHVSFLFVMCNTPTQTNGV